MILAQMFQQNEEEIFGSTFIIITLLFLSHVHVAAAVPVASTVAATLKFINIFRVSL